MTFEQMLNYAERIAVDLTNAGYGPAEVLKEDAKPGDPIPIAIVIDGDEFVLALDVL
jgi:hypothetical protein